MFGKPRSYWKPVLYVSMTLVCFLFQCVPAFGVRFLGCAPSLLLLLTVGVAFFESPAVAGWFGLVAGLLSQLTTASVVGLDALIFMFAGFFISAALELFLQRKFPVYLYVSIGLCALHLLLDFLYHLLLWNGVSFRIALIGHMLPVFFFTALWAFPVYGVLYRFDRRFAAGEELL